MIASLTGHVQVIHPMLVIMLVGGVGYEVHVTRAISEKASKEETTLHTHQIFREDAQLLYGFLDPRERQFFRLLVDKVQGVGPKIGLTLLDQLGVDGLKALIAAKDADGIAKTKGIGKKTAEKIIVELYDLLGGSESATAVSTEYKDALLALVALGYKNAEARAALEKVKARGVSSDTLVRKALDQLSGNRK
jgi:Holliday junction DNA helicase RuvA